MDLRNTVLGRNRKNTAELRHEYSELIQTQDQLAEKYGRPYRTIKRKMDTYTPSKGTTSPCRVIVVMDTIYSGKEYGVMLFNDALTGRSMPWYFIKKETHARSAQGIAELIGWGIRYQQWCVTGGKGFQGCFPTKL